MYCDKTAEARITRCSLYLIVRVCGTVFTVLLFAFFSTEFFQTTCYSLNKYYIVSCGQLIRPMYVIVELICSAALCSFACLLNIFIYQTAGSINNLTNK